MWYVYYFPFYVSLLVQWDCIFFHIGQISQEVNNYIIFKSYIRRISYVKFRIIQLYSMNLIIQKQVWPFFAIFHLLYFGWLSLWRFPVLHTFLGRCTVLPFFNSFSQLHFVGQWHTWPGISCKFLFSRNLYFVSSLEEEMPSLTMTGLTNRLISQSINYSKIPLQSMVPIHFTDYHNSVTL